MPIIKWDDSFSVGNDRIDAEHQKWIAMYNQAHDKMMAMGRKDHREIAYSALAQMLEYTRYHFASEEQWMKDINYPGFERHRQKHELFLRRVQKIRNEYDKGNPMLNSELMKVMENWLMNHILKEDKKIAK